MSYKYIYIPCMYIYFYITVQSSVWPHITNICDKIYEFMNDEHLHYGHEVYHQVCTLTLCISTPINVTEVKYHIMVLLLSSNTIKMSMYCTVPGVETQI